MIRVGIVGYGFSARTFHVPFLAVSEQLALTAVSSSHPDVVHSELPAVEVFPTADELFARGRTDLVIITAPNQAHFELARRALQAGIHVVLEKPMVTSLAEAETLFALAEARSRLLTVYQNRRWDGDFLTLRQLLAQDALGEVRYFESHFDRYRPVVQRRWREQAGPASGLWWDLGPHLVDQALCLFGMPQAVTARLLTTREDAETTDFFHVQLHYPRSEVVLHASSLSAGPNRRFLVEGDKASFSKFGLDPQEGQLRAGVRPGTAGFGSEPNDAHGVLHDAAGERRIRTETGNYLRFFTAMAASINDGAAVPVSKADALGLVSILEAAEESQASGGSCRPRTGTSGD